MSKQYMQVRKGDFLYLKGKALMYFATFHDAQHNVIAEAVTNDLDALALVVPPDTVRVVVSHLETGEIAFYKRKARTIN